MADKANCDVCGRIVNTNADGGGLVNQRGGYACDRCAAWAEKNKITCPKCGKPVIYGVYEDMCACDGITVTRKAAKEESADE